MKSPNTSTLDSGGYTHTPMGFGVTLQSKGGLTHTPMGFGVSLRRVGFTMIEMLVTLAIITFIATIGIVLSLDTYGRYVFRSDLDKTVSLLQKARSSSINNIGESTYGVKIYDEDNPDNLILFRGTYTPSDSYNYEVEKSSTVTYEDTCGSDHQVVFAQLTGNTTSCEIVIKDGDKVATITINSQGGINY